MGGEEGGLVEKNILFSISLCPNKTLHELRTITSTKSWVGVLVVVVVTVGK